MSEATSRKTFLRDNGLSLTLLTLFLLFWTGQALTGLSEHNREERKHGKPGIELGEYLVSDHFWEATFENWESEFLQMSAYVVLTVFLYQRGSAESRDPDKARHIGHVETSDRRRKRWRTRLREHSLSLALAGLFLFSWSGHALAGWKHYNDEQADDKRSALSFTQYLGAPRFWFESFQNWQSEFLAVASIVLLSIWLREKDSPESKRMSSTNAETGK